MAMAVLAERYGAQIAPVAVAHSLRVSLVAILIPFGLTYGGFPQGGRRVPASLAAEHSYSRDLAGYRAKFQKNFTFITAPFWCRSFSVLRVAVRKPVTSIGS